MEALEQPAPTWRLVKEPRFTFTWDLQKKGFFGWKTVTSITGATNEELIAHAKAYIHNQIIYVE